VGGHLINRWGPGAAGIDTPQKAAALGIPGHYAGQPGQDYQHDPIGTALEDLGAASLPFGGEAAGAGEVGAAEVGAGEAAEAGAASAESSLGGVTGGVRTGRVDTPGQPAAAAQRPGLPTGVAGRGPAAPTSRPRSPLVEPSP